MSPRQVAFHDHAPTPDDFLDAVLSGLVRRRKAIPCKYLYDERGSRLFERICALPEYYPTRTEIALLETHRREMADHVGPGCRLVDFGAGSSRKARLLLGALDRPRAYLPVEISREQLQASASAIASDHPGLRVTAVCTDYTRPFRLPVGPGRAVGFFPGSTIGNFTPGQARRFLATARRVLGNGPMLVGVDLKKPEAVLQAAYDDGAGVTAAFNLNLLARANRELGADFHLDRFRHRAAYDRRRCRVEMHLESLGRQTVRLRGRDFVLANGETIHTENSYKYAPDGFAAVAIGAGYRVARMWTDPARLFAVFMLDAVGE